MSKIKQAIGIMLFESDEFGGPKIVGGGICPTQRANKTCCGVIEVMETEQKIGNIFGFTGGNYAGNVYDKDHLSPTLNTMQGGCKQPMIIDEPKCLNSKGGRGGVEGLQPSLQDRVYSADAVSTAITTSFMPNILEDKTIVAMRGRNPTNPSDRTPGIELEQTLEVNQNGTTNCLTSVQKDNLVLENVIAIDEQNMNVRTDTFGTLTTDGSSPKHNNRVMIKQATKQGYIECDVGGVADFSYPDSKTRRGRVQENGQVSPTLTAGEQDICRIGRDVINPLKGISENGWHFEQNVYDANGLVRSLKSESGSGNIPKAIVQYHIRKLTPKECWRLMDFSDEDFEKAAEVNSNTQLYKQAGNSIVVNVLVAILGQLLPGKENVYKELSE